MINRKNIIFAILLAIVIAIIGAGVKNSASATEGETCVPTEGQHYSWTGGHLPTNTPPTEVPPSDNWQANTSQEPHTNGQGNPATWVNASLHFTANSQGHASWFYYTAPVDCPPEQPDPKEFTTMDQKRDCTGIYTRFFDWIQHYVLVEGEWVLGEPELVSDTGWVKVRDLTTGELHDEGCYEQPDPDVFGNSSTSYECGDDFQTTTTTTTTIPAVWDEEYEEWVPGEPVTETEVTTEQVPVIPCDKNDPKDPQDQPEEPASPVKNTQQVAVPTAVDAGL